MKVSKWLVVTSVFGVLATSSLAVAWERGFIHRETGLKFRELQTVRKGKKEETKLNVISTRKGNYQKDPVGEEAFKEAVGNQPGCVKEAFAASKVDAIAQLENAGKEFSGPEHKIQLQTIRTHLEVIRYGKVDQVLRDGKTDKIDPSVAEAFEFSWTPVWMINKSQVKGVSYDELCARLKRQPLNGFNIVECYPYGERIMIQTTPIYRYVTVKPPKPAEAAPVRQPLYSPAQRAAREKAAKEAALKAQKDGTVPAVKVEPLPPSLVLSKKATELLKRQADLPFLLSEADGMKCRYGKEELELTARRVPYQVDEGSYSDEVFRQQKQLLEGVADMVEEQKMIDQIEVEGSTEEEQERERQRLEFEQKQQNKKDTKEELHDLMDGLGSIDSGKSESGSAS